MNAWAGIDRLLNGIKLYCKSTSAESDKQIRVHIAGSGKYFKHWQLQAARLGLSQSVIFHGSLSGSELDSLFQDADIAVGNLANHRRNLAENADLKNREYCARGIPFVISGRDGGFPDNFPFLHRVDANDTPLRIFDLIEFHTSVRLRYPDFNLRMRKFAEDTLDWRVVLKPVVTDMNIVLKNLNGNIGTAKLS